MHLSRDAIVSTALELLTQYGLADVTMRRVATNLGVAPGALYWHVANKQSLIAAMTAEILSPVSGESTAELVSSLQGELRRWRDGAEVAIAGAAFPESSASADLEELFITALQKEAPAASTEDSVVAARTLIHYILGATFMEQSREQLSGATPQGSSPSTATPSPHSAPVDATSVRAAELMVAGLRSLRSDHIHQN
ncbi:TetR family transcriptional regulator [Corynebacterium sp. HMSC062A03]|uniref:TetR family transcriptional regulator n=1 Tax=Corynebacterium sp. HMSC062A03 TaxID=1739285 RepID=UPI0008A4669A|nr:TetR family transcriptional regulator [Corynebacterium sp. HMSC062A03]OFL19770.1 TetR family transcriptional regulator [Corynebacterium sp. HMSC062A03]